MNWLKRFFNGMWLACEILIIIGVVYTACELGGRMLLAGIAWLEGILPITTSVIVLGCIGFVVVFGLIQTVWD